MIEFDDLSSSLRHRLPQVLGLGMLALVVTAELVFALLQIVPTARAHSELSTQLADARQALSPPTGEVEIETLLQAKLAKMQEALDEQAGTFLAESEVPVVLNHLYRYAEESGVQITQIEAARAAGPDTSKEAVPAHDVQSFQVEVSGRILQLIDFATRLREASLPTVVIDHLAIKQGKATEGASTLTMDLLLYTSPYATGEASTTPQP